MEINGISTGALNPASELNQTARKSSDISDVSTSFGKVLESALQSVEKQERQARQMTDQFITGQTSDVHSLMIASEKAMLGIQLTVQVRNKVIEAYQEIMRTQL